MTASERPDRLRIDGKTIIYDGPHGWRCELHAITLIGEFTNENGPFSDDWFCVFFTLPEERPGYDMLKAPVYAGTAPSFFDDLAQIVGVSPEAMQPKLYGSTTFASRIIWPLHLAGMPAFDFETVTLRSILARKHRLRDWGAVYEIPTTDVLEVVDIERTQSHA